MAFSLRHVLVLTRELHIMLFRDDSGSTRLEEFNSSSLQGGSRPIGADAYYY